MREAEPITLLDGNRFVVSDDAGDICSSYHFPSGLFSFDTRFLSTWILSINGERLHPLSVDDLQYFESRFFLAPGEPTHYIDAQLSVIRRRSIAGRFDEDLTVLNHRSEWVELTVRIDIENDFADFSEIGEPVVRKGRISVTTGENQLRISYARESFLRETVITASDPVTVDPGGMTFHPRIAPHSSWTGTLTVDTLMLGGENRDLRDSLSSRVNRTKAQTLADLDDWIARAPQLTSRSEALNEAYERSVIDLAALRYRGLVSGEYLPAAGLPYYMTLFGRQGIITCLQTLPFLPDLTRPTLRALAAVQGTRLDDFREEEPGKILYQVRYGESSAFDELPHSLSYGAADTTPLFVVLLDEYERWTGDADLVRQLRHVARRALDWIDTYGNLLGDGYVRYEPRNPHHGPVNQCWKESPDSVSFADGRLPGPYRATCELQGYAYDAKMRGARLARLFWGEPEYADRLEREAYDLKQRFNRDFWVEDGEYYALGLDSNGARIDALASNMGHLLWSGIVDEQRAAAVARRLLGPELFSGWGVRTLAAGQARYNPVGYHVGSVWPADNSLIAWGLRRYGFAEEAGRIAVGMFDAARYFNGRLPETFGGYDRARTSFPVRYPSACSPYGGSAGSILLLMRVLLGMEPIGGRLTVDAALPGAVGAIALGGVPGRWGYADVSGRLSSRPPGHRPLVARPQDQNVRGSNPFGRA